MGNLLFKALITVTNKFSEIRLQLHIVTDKYEQMWYAIEAFNETVRVYGQEPLELLATDNTTVDKETYHRLFPSLV